MNENKLKIKINYNNNQETEIEFNKEENYRKIKNKINKICSITLKDRDVENYFLNDNNERNGYYTEKDHKLFLRQKNHTIYIINRDPNKKTIVFKIEEEKEKKTYYFLNQQIEKEKIDKIIKSNINQNLLKFIIIVNKEIITKIVNEIQEIIKINLKLKQSDIFNPQCFIIIFGPKNIEKNFDFVQNFSKICDSLKLKMVDIDFNKIINKNFFKFLPFNENKEKLFFGFFLGY